MISDPDGDKLDDLRFMLGRPAGNLALALDQLTDAMAMVNMHAIYCRVEKGPRAGQPPLDVAGLLQLLAGIKELVRESMQELRKSS